MQWTLRHIVGLFIVLFGLPVCAEVQDKSFDEGSIFWFDKCSLELKSGVYRPDPFTGRIRVVAVTGDIKEEVVDPKLQEYTLDFVLATDANARANNFDVGASCRTLGASGYFKLKQAEAEGNKSVNVSLVVGARRSFGIRRLRNYKLTVEAEKRFTENPQFAEQTYGTHFVSGVERGASVSAVLTFSMDTREASSLFSTDGGAAISAFGFGGDVQTKLKDSFMRAFQERRMNAEVKAYGGAPIDFDTAALFQSQNFEGAEGVIAKFVRDAVSKFQSTNAVETRFYLTRFADISTGIPRDLWRQQQEQKLKQLVQDYDRVSAQLQRLGGHLDSRAGSRFSVPAVDQRVELKRIREKLEAYRDYVAKAHKALIDGNVLLDPKEPVLSASEMEAFWLFVNSKTPFEELNDRLSALESRVGATPRVIWMRKDLTATTVAGEDRRSNANAGKFEIDLKQHPTKPAKVISAEAIPIFSDLQFIEGNGEPDDHFIMRLSQGALSVQVSGTVVSGQYHALMRDDNKNVGKGTCVLLIIALVQD